MADHFEVAIIGSGPGGLGAAANAAERKLSHVLFEKSQIANTIYEYQLKKYVMAEPARLPLRAHVQFDAGSRESILDSWAKSLADLKVNVRRAEVSAIKKNGENFEITFSGGTCTAKHVILAIGCQGTPRKLGVPGEELPLKVSGLDLPYVNYTLSDPGAFVGKTIIVVGAGDAGIENAVALSEQNKVFILNRSGEFARAKEGNIKLITNTIASGKIRCYYNSEVARIEEGTVYLKTPEGEVATKCDHIIVRAGAILPRKFLEGCGVQFPNKDPNAVPVVSNKYESNVPGLFIVGALIGYPLIKQAINQGHEVIEHILGNPIEPADQVLVDERFVGIPGSVADNYKKIVDALPLFKELSEPQYRELIIDSTMHLKKQGEIVFERNDYTDSFFSVVEGSIEIELPNNKSIRLGKGNFFGEMGLISGRRRTATVRAGEPNTFLVETPRKQMIKLLSSVPSVKRSLDEIFMLRALQTSIFPDVEVKFLEDLVKRAEMRNFKKGEVLFKEGDIGDVLYVVRKGSVKISRRSNTGVDVAQTYIPAGNYVGEMALLREEDGPRSATVSATVPTETILIKKSDFLELLNSNPKARERITRVAEERQIENITTNWSEQSGSLLDFMFQQGIADAENVLLIDSDLCVACDNCEAACASTHGGYSRLDRKGGRSFASIQVPISCRHCENPLCMLDCPPDALTRMPNGEVMIRDSCIGCGNCASNCPYGVIQLVYDHHRSPFQFLKEVLGLAKHEKGPAKAAKCDMCRDLGSGPACVRACPTGAAMRVNPSKLIQIVSQKRETAA